MKRFYKLLALVFWLIPAIAFANPQQVDFLLSGMTDTNGQALSGGKIYTYSAGTTSNKTTWSDFGETTPLTNPIILDAYGKKQVFADGLYKFVVQNSSGATLYTFDNLLYSPYTGVSLYGGTATGSSGAYAITVSPPLVGSPPTGMTVAFTANATSVGANTNTLNVNGTGANKLGTKSGDFLLDGEIVSGNTYIAVFTGSQWNVFNLTASDWITYSPTLTGFSANPANASYRYQYMNDKRTINLIVTQATAGTSNATSFQISLPWNAKTVTNAQWGATTWSCTDNGAALTVPCQAAITSGGTTVILSKTVAGAGGSWTNANGKGASFSIIYQPDF